MNLTVLVYRHKASYKFKRLPDEIDGWRNNDAQNMKDEISLWDGEQEIFFARCQTVANIPGGRVEDTIAPGKFKLKLFVPQRAFHCRIHGIVDAYDIEGQYTDFESVQANDKNRWLVHDTQKVKPNPPGVRTRVAWSAGCFIMTPEKLEEFNMILESYKYKAGDIIEGELKEI